jgi:hypothetical protein
VTALLVFLVAYLLLVAAICATLTCCGVRARDRKGA